MRTPWGSLDYTPPPPPAGREDAEVTHGISSRTSCSENKALEEKAREEEAAPTRPPGPPLAGVDPPAWLCRAQAAGRSDPLQGPEGPT